MITFDPKTTHIFESSQEDIFISIIQSGCNGNSIDIGKYEKYESKNYKKISSNLQNNISVYIFQKDEGIFENARITRVQNKWILTSEKVFSHCGCAKSFSIRSDDEKHNKITLLKEKLRKAKKKSCN